MQCYVVLGPNSQSDLRQVEFKQFWKPGECYIINVCTTQGDYVKKFI